MNFVIFTPGILARDFGGILSVIATIKCKCDMNKTSCTFARSPALFVCVFFFLLGGGGAFCIKYGLQCL